MEAIDTDGNGALRSLIDGGIAMKVVVSALLALSVLAGVANSASALDAKTFWEQQERSQS